MQLTPDIYQRIVAAKVYIDDNYSEPIDLDEISRKAFLSKFHFHRLFRQIYRHTPHQYVTRKRLQKAKDLLAINKPVTEVCNEVGFESIGSFSILFKKEIGFAPRITGIWLIRKRWNSGHNQRQLFRIVLSRHIS